MDKTDCLRILNEAIQMGVQEVAFSGGEPLLWPHLKDAIILAKEGSMRVSIYTSGNVSDINHKLSMIKNLNVDRCIYSIFASFQEMHDRITSRLLKNQCNLVESPILGRIRNHYDGQIIG